MINAIDFSNEEILENKNFHNTSSSKWDEIFQKESSLSYLQEGMLPTVKYGKELLLRSRYGISILTGKVLYHLWDNNSGWLRDALENFKVSEETPVAVIMTVSQQVKKKLSGFKYVALVNADTNAFTSKIGSPACAYDSLGKLGLPMTSFACLCEMIDTSCKEFLSLLSNGAIQLIDFTAEEERKLTKKELDAAHKSKKNKQIPLNFGLVPPERGFSLIIRGNKKVWHRSGATLLRYESPIGEKIYYLFGQDEGTYFGCELPRPCKNIGDAYSSLVPPELSKRFDFVGKVNGLSFQSIKIKCHSIKIAF